MTTSLTTLKRYHIYVHIDELPNPWKYGWVSKSMKTWMNYQIHDTTSIIYQMSYQIHENSDKLSSLWTQRWVTKLTHSWKHGCITKSMKTWICFQIPENMDKSQTVWNMDKLPNPWQHALVTKFMTTLISYQIADNMDKLPCLCVGWSGEVTGWGKRGLVEIRERREAIQRKHTVNLKHLFCFISKDKND